MLQFIHIFCEYFIEVLPALLIGFILSGFIHEFISIQWVEKYLGDKGMKPIFLATIIGTVLPLCCVGALPVALSFYKKGAKLGPVLAFLIATPATSATALLVSWRILGPTFTIFIFFAVILMGLTIGFIGNTLKFKSPSISNTDVCPKCAHQPERCNCAKTSTQRIKSMGKFAFLDMPKDIGPELLLGLALAALISVIVPIGTIIDTYLAGRLGYLFGLVFGLLMYICSTASIPLVDALIKQGLNIGAGMVILLAGPVTSYTTILVMKKQFGIKILLFYLIVISLLSLIFGYIFELIQ
ncbi:MAG: permease [Candidatus Stahlbacteria bacterium]|nr:permease [Candidatus Stahlbacteria bacterium]